VLRLRIPIVDNGKRFLRIPMPSDVGEGNVILIVAIQNRDGGALDLDAGVVWLYSWLRLRGSNPVEFDGFNCGIFAIIKSQCLRVFV